MASTRPDVSIIIVSWNTRDLLLQCIGSLSAARASINADVWIVDNGSSDGSVQAVRAQFPTVQVIANQHNAGFAAANNQAIRSSRGRYVLLLNSDTLALPGSIAQLVHVADAHPRAAAVGLMLTNPDGSFQASFSRFPSFGSEFLNVSGLGRRIVGPWYPSYGPEKSRVQRRVEVLPGACMLIRRAAIDQVGLMDEHYFMYSEETDWCLRFHRSGWQLWYTPAAQIMHYGGQSTRQMRQSMLRALYRSKVRFFRKHYGWLPALGLHTLFLIALHGKWLVDQVRALGRSSTVVGAPPRRRDLQSTPIQDIAPQAIAEH